MAQHHLNLTSADLGEPDDEELRRAQERMAAAAEDEVTVTLGPRTRVARDIDYAADAMGVDTPSDN